MIFLRKGCRFSKLNVVERAEVAVDAKKLFVLLPMWVCYLVGTIFGAYMETMFKIYALVVPASLTLSVGLVYIFFRQQVKGYLKRIERERLSRDMQDMQKTMERTHAYIKTVKAHSDSGNPDEDGLVVDLDQEMGNMLDTMRNVETDLMGMCERPAFSFESERSRTAPF